MKKDQGKKPLKVNKKTPAKRLKTKGESALEDFLENKRLSQERLDEDRAKAKKLTGAKTLQDKPAPIKKNAQEKPLDLQRDLRTRNLVDQFYGGEEEPEAVEGVEENSFDETPVDETLEEDFAEEQEFTKQVAMVDAAPEESSDDVRSALLDSMMGDVEPDEPSDDVRSALLESMRKRGEVREERKFSPKDKEKAEQVNMALNAAQGLYTGTRRVTRETLEFAGDLAKGTVGVATGVAGGVLSLVGKSILGVVRVAGMGYRGVGTVASGLSGGIPDFGGKVKEAKKGLSVSSVTSGVVKKTSSFLCIEDARKGQD